MEPYKVGIDFGACNIKAAGIEDGKILPIKLNTYEYGGEHTPNVLLYSRMKSGKTQLTLGDKALTKAKATNRQNLVEDIKRKLQQPCWSQYIPALEREAELGEVTRDIFAALKKYLPLEDEQEAEAVLTIPVNFSTAQIARLRRGAEDAGLKVRDIISEPFAAMFALKDTGRDELALVFDFGGSTLDISVAKIERADGELSISELAAEGLAFGGRDIDELIYNDILTEEDKENISATLGENVTPDVLRQTIMRQNIAPAKERIFGEGGEEEENITYEPDIRVRRDAIEAALHSSGAMERIKATLDSLFNELADGPEAYTRDDITLILPLGGTARIPLFAELLENYFGPDKFSARDFDYENAKMLDDAIKSRYMAVTVGAASYLKALDSDSAPACSSVVPFRLGFKKGDQFIPCLGKNTPRGGSYRSPRKIYPVSELVANDWRIPLFQAFGGQDSDEITFIQEICLNKELYLDDHPVMLMFNITKDGDLRAVITQQQVFGEEGDSGEVLVEERIISLRGEGNAG